MIGLGLGLSPGHRQLGGGFSPASLFANGEQGIWIDPSDLSTMFQYVAGATPVTAPGQNVALMLDKSRRPGLGPELAASLPTPSLTNFGGSSGSWNTSTRIMSNTTTGTDTGYPRFAFNLGLQGGRRYRVSGHLTGDLAAVQEVRLATEGANNGVTFNPVSGIFEARQLAAGASLQFLFDGTYGPASVQIAAISVREVPGAHAAQTISARRPTYQSAGGLHYLYKDPIDDSLPVTMPDLGTDATVAYATEAGTTILTGQTIGAGAYETLKGEYNYGLVVVDRALTPEETTAVTRYLTARIPA